MTSRSVRGAKPPKEVKDPGGRLRPVGLGRQPKEEIQSVDWYESVARTDIEKRQAVELKREVGAVGAIVGMSVEHGYDMVALQQEVERLRLERDRVKVNNDLENARMAFKRDEWLLGKRVGVKEAKDLRSQVPRGSLYDPVYGFEVRIDAVTPTPPGKGEAIVLVYGLFEGTTKSGPLKTTQRSAPEYSFKTRMKRARFEVAHDFVKLAPNRNVSLVIEVQVAVGEFSTQAAGWTVLPIFTEEGDVLQGDWSVPVFAPPLSIGIPRDQLNDLPLAQGLPNVLIRLARNRPRSEEFDEYGDTPEPEEFEEEEKPAPDDSQYLLPPNMSLPTPRWVRQEYEIAPPEAPKTPLAGIEGLNSLKMEKDDGRDSKLSGLEGIHERAWVDYVAPPSALKPCSAPDILVVILDAARFLPDNVSVTRATLSLVNEQGVPLTEEATTTDVGDVDSGVHSPRFALAVVLLVQDLSPRTWMSVRIDAVDPMSGNKSVTVGFATLPLLLHPATGRTPSQDQANTYNKDLKAHLDSLDPPEGQQQEEIRRAGIRPPPRLRVQTGGVQIPIRVAPGAYVSRDPSTLGKQPRMPCCTAILRVFLNPTDEDAAAAVEKAGLRAVLDDYLEEEEAAKERERISKMAPQAKRKGQVRDGLGRERDAGDREAEEEEERVLRIVRKLSSNKPPYPTGQYDSSSCHPSGSEGAMYSVRLAQFTKDITIRDSLAQLLDEKTYDSVRGSTAAAREAARNVISKGDEGRLPPTDLTYFCAYNPGVGLKAAVDGANNLPLPGRSRKGAIPICFMGVSSQCNFFTAERMTLDAHANCAIVLDSSVKHPRWAEGYRSIQNVPFRGETGGLIIQVAWLLGHTKEGGWQEKDAKIESVGWTAVSLFTSETLPYVTCGSFVVPLYKGEVPIDVGDKLDVIGVEKTLKKMEEEGRAKLLGEASVLVRLVDLQRGATANPTMPPVCDDANLNLPREWSEKMVASWASGQIRMDGPKVAKYWQVQKGLLEGRTKVFKETHLGKVEKEATFQESMRSILTNITGIQTVEIQTHAAPGSGA
uniref:C2 domain-containing protein n=3 Tax=Hemiselmis andersenii TaxID=464988 RepID=A0A7S1EJ12_HEMAN